MSSCLLRVRSGAAIAALTVIAGLGPAALTASAHAHANAHANAHARSHAHSRAHRKRVARPRGVPGPWRLVLNSTFTGHRLPLRWRAGWFGTGVTAPVNSYEQACYSPRNVVVSGGSLHLDVTTTPSNCHGMNKPYTGAAVTTDPNDGRHTVGFQYTYGVLQAKVFIPATGGPIANWPAVWTDGQSWPADGEDDVMEGLSGQACFHFHDPGGGPGACDNRITPGWHTFASDWQPGSVTYYYDGRYVGRIAAGITSAPMYIVLDNTVAPGQSRTTGAATMRVAYVRVWQDRGPGARGPRR